MLVAAALAGAAHAAAAEPDPGAADTTSSAAGLADTLAVAASATPPAAFPPPRVRAWQVGLLRGDRMQHASFSFALTAAFTLLSRDRRLGAGVALAFGIGKELLDARTDRFDPMDLAADAAGVGLATLAVDPRGE